MSHEGKDRFHDTLLSLTKDYAKSLNWRDWVGVGPPSQYLPIPSLLALVMRSKFKSVDSTEQMLHQVLFDKIRDEAEKEKFAAYCQKFGKTPNEFIKTWAGESAKSVENGWEGFEQSAAALRSDCGSTFPLDAEHARRKALIRVTKGDYLRSGMGEYLTQNYVNSEFIVGEGGHFSGIYTLQDDIIHLLDD